MVKGSEGNTLVKSEDFRSVCSDSSHLCQAPCNICWSPILMAISHEHLGTECWVGHSLPSQQLSPPHYPARSIHPHAVVQVRLREADR